MNIQDVAYNVIHDYPGGVPALAVRLGMSANVLQNKANPSQETHKLTLLEAAKISELTQDTRMADAMASLVGCVLIPMGRFEGISDMALLEVYTGMMAKIGTFSQDLSQSLADGKITKKEIDQLEADMYLVQQAGSELLNRAKQLVQGDGNE